MSVKRSKEVLLELTNGIEEEREKETNLKITKQA